MYIIIIYLLDATSESVQFLIWIAKLVISYYIVFALQISD